MFKRLGFFIFAAVTASFPILSASPAEARFVPNGEQAQAAAPARTVAHRSRAHARRAYARRSHARSAGGQGRLHRHAGRRVHGGVHRNATSSTRFLVASDFRPACAQTERRSQVGGGWARIETLRICYER